MKNSNLAAFKLVIVLIMSGLFGLKSLATPGGDNYYNDDRFALVGRDAHGGTDAGISRDGRYVVTSSNRSGSYDLWLLEVATGEWTQLTFGKSDEIEPQWSPDGTKVAYTSTESGNKDVFWLTIADKKPIRVTSSEEDDEYASWAPDNKRIVFTTGPWKKRHFMVLDTSAKIPYDTAAEKVNEVSGHVGACTFHNTGQSLLCHTYENGFGDLVQLDLNGRLIKKITEGQKWDYKPHISKDDQAVAFSRITSNSSSIWMKSMNGDEVQQITSSIDNDRWPMFYTNQGQDYLFFHRLVNRGASIAIYNRTTQQKETIVGPKEKPLRAAFDQSAERIAYCAIVEKRNVVKIYNRATKQNKTIDMGGYESCYPEWSPKNDEIAFLVRHDGTWQLATYNLQSETVTTLTTDEILPNGITGPIDWSPDGQHITFTANTSPYESDVFIFGLEKRKLRNLTQDDWYDESASWDQNGNILFMSTRGGAWTWGLFRLSLDDLDNFEIISEPNYVEKNYPKQGADQSLIWSEYRMCDGTEYIALKESSQDAELIRELPGARWPSISSDGNEILLTQMQKYIEFWSVRLDDGSAY